MITQTKEEISAAMQEDPDTWAELYIQLMAQISVYEAMLKVNAGAKKH